MKFNAPTSIKQRLLSPRVVIYIILAIAAAWLMNRYGQNVQQMPQAIPGPATIRPANSNNLPMLVIIPAEGEDLDAVVANAQKRYSDKINVTRLTIAPGNSAIVKQTFAIDTLPAAILCDANNMELNRYEGPLDDARIDEILKEAKE